MSLSLLFSKIIVRLGLGDFFFYFLKTICKGFKNEPILQEEAESILNNISPDKGSSCLQEHQITTDPHYDLQIIVPVYNVEKYVEECVNSIVNQQTKYNVKTIMINDGSKDRSRELLKKYENLSNVEIIDQENRGFSGARNRGLEQIEARYVMFVDSDDRLTDGSIECLLNKAYQTNADIVAGGYRLFRDEKILGIKTFKEDNNSEYSGGGYVWGKIYRSNLFKHIGFPEGYWFEDSLNPIIIKGLSKQNAIINNVVYDYRQNPKGITQTSKGNKRNIDSYWITKRLLEDRLILGLKDDQHLYELLLKQTGWNCLRIASIGSAKANIALYSCCSNWWNGRFKDFETKQNSCLELEKALRTHNYKLYKLCCYLIR